MSDEIRDDGSSALSQTAKALLRPPYHTLAIAAVAVMGGAVVGAMASGYGASGFGASSSLRLDESALRTIASEVLNDATISHIQCGVGPDLCEVLAGDSLLYMDRSGRYGIAGSILDFQTRTDLTAAREQDLRRFVAVAAGRNFADAADVAAAARPAATEAPLRKPETVPAADAAGTALIQLGAFSSASLADSSWAGYARRFEAIGALPKKILPGSLDGGTIYRLNAVAPSREAAQQICNNLKAAGESCLVVR